MSFFTRTRSAKTVGKDHFCLSLKTQYIDYDEKRTDGRYHDLPSQDKYWLLKNVLCVKYGWAENHHLGLGIPYIWNEFDVGNADDENAGLGNVYVFEKWNCIQEDERVPGISVDLWHYFSTGDSDKKLGSSDSSWRTTIEVSKAWPGFSLHFNPGYVFSKDGESDQVQIDAALLCTSWKKFWPALEYNYTNKIGKGKSCDLMPGFICKFAPGWSFKAAVVLNMRRTMTYRDEVGFVTKIFRRF